MIKPTVGRVVWFTPGSNDVIALRKREGDDEVIQSLAAIITFVWSDNCVNLAVFDANGNSHSRTSVLLVQEDGARPAACFCEWMPYQKGQAAKTEALEAKIGAGAGPLFSNTPGPGATNPAVGPQRAVQDSEIPNRAPRVTPDEIEANIVGETYFTGEQGRAAAVGHDGKSPERGYFSAGGHCPLELLTICILVLSNGFTVVGTSACASPENFDAEIGRRIARQDAVRQVWPLMGYALRDRLANGQPA